MVGSLAALAILWQIIAELLQNRYLPTPVAVFDVLLREAENGELWKHTSATLLRVFFAFVISMFIGTAIGLLIWLYISAFIVIVGADVNAELEKQAIGTESLAPSA